MEPFHDSCGPSIERGVLARLQRLDSSLRVTFCRWAINPMTGQPQPTNAAGDPFTGHLVEKRGDTDLLRDPAYHLWLKKPSGEWVWVRGYAADGGFGHREVFNLEADAARMMSAMEILNKTRARQDSISEQGQKNALQLHQDVTKANFKRIQRLCHDHDKSYDPTTRDAKIVSYPGQVNRGTRFSKIEKDAKEDGWELPTR